MFGPRRPSGIFDLLRSEEGPQDPSSVGAGTELESEVRRPRFSLFGDTKVQWVKHQKQYRRGPVSPPTEQVGVGPGDSLTNRESSGKLDGRPGGGGGSLGTDVGRVPSSGFGCPRDTRTVDPRVSGRHNLGPVDRGRNHRWGLERDEDVEGRKGRDRPGTTYRGEDPSAYTAHVHGET